MIKNILTLILLLCLSSCGAEKGNNSEVYVEDGDNVIEQEILSVFHSKKAPKDFYPKESNSVFYERVLKNNEWVFYCSDDLEEAKEKVEAGIDKYNNRETQGGQLEKLGRSVRVIVEDYEDEKFFQWKTEEASKGLNGVITKYYLSHRVIKCSYLSDRERVKDRELGLKYNGTFSQRPITKENVKELAEFLWYSMESNYNLSNNEPLYSQGKEEDGYIEHIVYYSNKHNFDSMGISSGGGVSNISLMKAIYIVDKETGKIEAKLDEEIKENIESKGGFIEKE